MLAQLTETEFRAFMAPETWMTMEQSLVMTVAILVMGGFCVYTCLRTHQRLLREMAEVYKEMRANYLAAPPEMRFRIEMRERETNANYRQWLATTEKGREWERDFQRFLRSEEGREWRARYEASRSRMNSSKRSNSEELQ